MPGVWLWDPVPEGTATLLAVGAPPAGDFDAPAPKFDLFEDTLYAKPIAVGRQLFELTRDSYGFAGPRPIISLNQSETTALLRHMGARSFTSPNLPPLGTVSNCETKQLHLPPDDNDGISFHVSVCCKAQDGTSDDHWPDAGVAEPPPAIVADAGPAPARDDAGGGDASAPEVDAGAVDAGAAALTAQTADAGTAAASSDESSQKYLLAAKRVESASSPAATPGPSSTEPAPSSASASDSARSSAGCSATAAHPPGAPATGSTIVAGFLAFALRRRRRAHRLRQSP